MKPTRWPIIGLIVAAAVGAFLVRSTGLPEPLEDATGPQQLPLAAMPAESSLVSTWFCAGGRAALGDDGEHVVILVNDTDRTRSGVVRVISSEGARANSNVSLEPFERRSIRLSSLLADEAGAGDSRPATAAIIEFGGDGLAAFHEVRQAGGRDLTACADRVSGSWYVPWGRTGREDVLELVIFNPFPESAVVDIAFDSDDGRRTPQAYEGLVIPAESVVVTDVGVEVQRRERVAASVIARTGRIVVDRVQLVRDEAGDPTGLDLSPGLSLPADTWVFADGRIGPRTDERIVVFNPGAEAAQVTISVIGDGTEGSTRIEPIDLDVGAGRQVEVRLNEAAPVADELGHATVVESRNGIPIVAEQIWLGSVAEADETVGPDTTTAGLAIVSGLPLAATEFIIVDGDDDGGQGATTSGTRVSLYNPSFVASTTAVIETIGGAFDGRRLESVDIPPQGRTTLDLEGDPSNPGYHRVVAEAPVAVARLVDRGSGSDLAIDVGVAATAGARVLPLAEDG